MIMEQAERPIVGLVTGNSRGSVNAEQEFHQQLAGLVDVATTRIPLYRISYGDLDKMIDNLPGAAEMLTDSGASIIVWNSVSGSSLHGQETANLLEQRVGVPVLLPSIEFVNSLRELGARRIALVTPHGVELSLLEKIFFDRNDIEVRKVIHLVENTGGDVFKIDKVTGADVLAEVQKRNFDDVDAVVFDSPTCSIYAIARELEAHTGRPLLPHNQILMRSALRRLGLPTDRIFIDAYFH